MSRYVVDAVVLEGRSAREVARAHGVSKSWVYELVSRYRKGGYEAIEPQSRRPRSVPTQTAKKVEAQVVRIRNRLVKQGFDAGAQTIWYHLNSSLEDPPSPSTVWRILKRRGLITPQPQKRPRSSYIRFEAALPNECWQGDFTKWTLKDGTEVEILDIIDDHSRLAVASKVFVRAKAGNVINTFHKAAGRWGYPASLLTDNGAVFNANSRGGTTVLQSELFRLGITYKHSRPYHPRTCGKVERFHQTLKKFLSAQAPAENPRQLQSQINRFIKYYNLVRPHRARGRMTPFQAYEARDKARPIPRELSSQFRVRNDIVDRSGTVSLRHLSRMHHIGVGRKYAGVRVTLLIADLEIRVVSENGELLRKLTLDATKDYQPLEAEAV